MGTVCDAASVMDSSERIIPIGARRFTIPIDAPLTPRFKTRLEKAVTVALRDPTRAIPTLRRAVMAATRLLRCQGLDDEHIRIVFARLIEDVARKSTFDATSIVTGERRSETLAKRVDTWIPIFAIEESGRSN